MKIKISTLIPALLFLHINLHAQAWQLQDPAFLYRTTAFDVFCPNTTDAWTFGLELDSATLYLTEMNYTLSRTTDGGENWESIAFPHNEPGYFSCLSALNGDVAWISYVDYTEGNKLLKTSDGGKNWDLLPVTVNIWINIGHLFNDSVGLVVGDPDSLGFEIFTTDDSGDTWERVDPTTLPASLPDELGLSGYYEVVGSSIWFETSAGRVFFSPDYGHTWSAIDGALQDQYFMFAADDAGTLYMSYTTAGNPDGSDPLTSLYRSADNGLSWEDITMADNGWWIVDIEPVPGTNTIIASLNAGFTTGLFETRISYDRGTSWTTIDNSSQTMVLDFADAETGFAGKWQTPDDLSPSRLYNYIGTPLTGLLDPKLLDIDLQVSPNPTSDFVEIKVNADANEDYLILLNDLSGRLLARSEFSEVSHIQHRLDMQSLPSGTYTITIANAHGSYTEKIVRL